MALALPHHWSHVISPLPLTGKIGAIPDGVRIYAISDIHGHVDLLDNVFVRLDRHLAKYPIKRPIHVFLGDYIDRGPTSRSVIDRLIERSSNHESVFLKGNHEELLIEFLKNPLVLDQWRHFGALETLVSYGLKPAAQITPKLRDQLAMELAAVLPASHNAFFSQLQSSYECGEYFFAHAGVRPGVALDQQNERDLLWIREEFLEHKEKFDKIIVHGHSPVSKLEILPNRINIDTGAYATGLLTCLMIEDGRLKSI